MKYFEFTQVVQEMLFEDFSYLELWLLTCLAELSRLVNFGRGHYEKRFCAIILKQHQLFRGRYFQIFLIQSSGGHLVQQ